MEFLEHVPLAPYTTLGIGGPARWFAEAETDQDVLEALRYSREHNLPVFVLGGGSNLLVADAGFHGLVLRIALRGVERSGDVLRAAAGADWDSLVQRAVQDGLAGIECLSGIPGTVGGTPVQNVGAYGQEVATTIVEVNAVDAATGKLVTIAGCDCGLGYRRSRFNREDQGRYIVTAVSYKLQPDGSPLVVYPELQRALAGMASPTLAHVRDAVCQLRRSKGMLLVEGDPDCRSAGSFFKNPVVPAGQAESLTAQLGEQLPRFADASGGVKLSAAWLISRAGFDKGFTLGNAAISSKHTLALVNRGGATAGDMVALRDLIAGEVLRQFGIQLQQEPVLLA
jgi:UDP-N-acetylmuramate dehydrogenase